MKNGAAVKELYSLRDLVATETGLYFSDINLTQFQQALSTVIDDLQLDSFQILLQGLKDSDLKSRYLSSIARRLTVGETYFFRDDGAFQDLEKRVLPSLIKQNSFSKRLKIWSAGCSSGEEPYSIAMLLTELLPDLDQWKISIIGSDINPDSIQKAREGAYAEWSFRNAAAWMERDHFTRMDSRHVIINDAIKNMVEFSVSNLAASAHVTLPEQLSDVDLILCRNVLMYFRNDAVDSVLRLLYKSLKDAGWLITSPIESSFVDGTQFKRAQDCGLYTFQKRGESEKELIDDYSGERIVRSIPAAPIPRSPASSRSSNATQDPNGMSTRRDLPDGQTGWDWLDTLKTIIHPFSFSNERQSAMVSNSAQTQIGTNKPDADDLKNAYQLANSGEWSDALRWCTGAIESDKTNSDAYCLRAVILAEMGRILEARDNLRRVLYLDPENVAAHFLAGNLAQGAGEYSKADLHFKNALRLVESLSDDTLLHRMEGITAGGVRTMINRFMESEVEE